MGDLHAVLIGIDAYATARPLHGCVNDIDAIQALLIDRLGVSPGAIRRLAAPQDGGASRPTTVPTLAPGRTQILGELAALTARVRRGDRVLVWYSGHGTQLQVAARDGRSFAREALMTVDGEYVFDWELSAALHALAAHAHVCMVLDCCSAAGATRDGLTARFHDAGSGVIAAQVEVPQLVATRGIAQAIGATTDAFVVAACLDDERACEIGGDRACHGVLTGALLDALAGVPQGELAALRWSQIWHRIEAAVASNSPGQHPWISSSPWRRVFGGAAELGDMGVACEWIPEARVLRIHAGTRSGVTIGAEIAVYGPEPARFPPRGSAEDERARVAVARVIEASDCEASATLVSQDPAVWPDQRRGRLVKAGDGMRLTVSVSAEAGALAARIARSDLLAVVHDGPADVTLALRPDGRWALTDDVYRLDEPALPTCERDDLACAVRLAEHYARYSMPLRLARRCSTDLLEVQLLDCNGRPDGWPAAEAQDPLAPPRQTRDDGTVVLQAGHAEDDTGDRFCVRITHRHTEPLWVTVLDCDSDGGVALLADRVPIGPAASAAVWHPGGLGWPFRATLAADQRAGIDRFVCIASTERTARFDHLALHATFATGEAPTRNVASEEAYAAFAARVVTARLAHVAAPVDAPLPRLRAELGRGLAIVIGIDAYSEGKLKNARADAEAIGARLAADHGFEVTPYLDATLDELRAVCTQLVERARGYERIIVYFAGHGVAELDDAGVVQGRLAASDTQFSASDTFLAMSALRGACEDAAAAPHDEAHAQYRMRKRHVLLLLDCCAAGALGTRQARGHRPQPLFRERYDRLLDHRAVQFIGAADHEQLAGDEIRSTQARRAGVAHSPFATALLAALACADGDGRRHPVDRDHDGVFLASELHAFLGTDLHRWTVTLRRELVQTPVYYTLRGHESGEMVFAAAKRRLPLPPAEQLRANASPYRGARPYEDSERDERVLFGRGEALAELDRHVKKHPLTVVLGASRTGKTSLVQAGLARRPRAAGWEIHRVAPGAVPPAALPAGADPRLLLVDPLDALAQFSAGEARSFLADLEQLVAARPNDRVVATLRDGNEALLGEAALAGPAPRWHAWPLPAMTHDTLRDAIEGPAETAVLFFEPSLVDLVINRALGRPGALGLVSRTLEAMFQRQVPRGDRTLTLDDFNAVGGVDGAVVQRAEALYQAVPGAQPMLTRILVRLADVRGDKIEPRALRADEIGAVGGDAELRSVLDRLDEELLIVRGAMIKVAHEAVLTRWGRVASLFEAQREALRVHAELAELAAARRLGGAHELWSAESFAAVHERLAGRAPRAGERIADVLQPARLVGRIAARMPVALGRDELEFLQASARKRRARALARAVPLVLAVVLAGVVKLAIDRVELARIERAKLDELSQVRAAADVARQDPRAIGTAIDKALAAFRPRQEHAPMLIQALLEVADAPATIASQVHRTAGQVLALSANGKVMTAVTRTQTALLVGPVAGEQATLVSPAPDNPAVAISPHGTWVAYAAPGELRLWCVADRRLDGQSIALPPGTHAFTLAFSGDESRIAVALGGAAPSIGVWSVAKHERIAQLDGVDGRTVLALDHAGAWLLANSALVEVASGRSTTIDSIARLHLAVAAFSPDGARLVVGGPDGVGVLQRIGDQALLQRWSRDPQGNVTAVAFSDDGTRMAVTTLDGDAVLWSSLDRGFSEAAAQYLVGATRDSSNAGSVVPIVFGTDFVAAVAINGAEVQVWNVDPPLSLDLHHAGPVLSLASSPSGSWLVTGSGDRTARVWDTRTGEQRLERGRVLPVTAVAATETWFAAGSIDDTVAMFRRDGGEQGAPILQLSAIKAIEISHSGWIASASGDGTVVVTDSLGAVKATLEHAPKKRGDPFSPDDPQSAVTAVAWLGDHMLASAGNNGLVKIWQLDPPIAPKPEPKWVLHHDAPVRSLAGSPDGSLVLSTAADGTAMLWRVTDGVQQARVEHRGPVTSGRFSPDGAQVVTASEDGSARIWDPANGHLIRTYDSVEPVRDAAFAPGGHARLVTVSDDGMLRVWNTASGQECNRIAAHSGRPSGPLVFLDRGHVASGGVDGSVRVFPMCTASVIRALCDRRDRSSAHAPGTAGACPVTQEEENACCP